MACPGDTEGSTRAHENGCRTELDRGNRRARAGERNAPRLRLPRERECVSGACRGAGFPACVTHHSSLARHALAQVFPSSTPYLQTVRSTTAANTIRGRWKATMTPAAAHAIRSIIRKRESD